MDEMLEVDVVVDAALGLRSDNINIDAEVANITSATSWQDVLFVYSHANIITKNLLYTYLA